MSSVRSATSAAHRVPSHAGPSPRAASTRPSTLGAAVPGSHNCRNPKGPLAHTPHSSAPGELALGVFHHHSAAVTWDLPHDRRVQSASPGQTHQVDMAGNSPVYSHGCKSSLPVAEGVAGKPGCTASGRKPYFRYSSQRSVQVELHPHSPSPDHPQSLLHSARRRPCCLVRPGAVGAKSQQSEHTAQM